jgi:hypothetical protein
MKILTDQTYGNKTLKRKEMFKIIIEIKDIKIQLIRGIPTSRKTNSLRTLSPLSPPPLNMAAAKHFQDLL